MNTTNPNDPTVAAYWMRNAERLSRLDSMQIKNIAICLASAYRRGMDACEDKARIDALAALVEGRADQPHIMVTHGSSVVEIWNGSGDEGPTTLRGAIDHMRARKA